MAQDIPSQLDLQTLYQDGLNAYQKGDLDAAVRIFEECRRVAPHHPAPVHTLGAIAYGRKDLALADKLLVEAIRLGGGKNSLLLRGQVLEAAGQDEMAFRVYKELLRSLPGHYVTNLALGGVKERLGDQVGARECYRIAVEANPDSFEAAKKYADIIWNDDPATAVTLMAGLLDRIGGNLDARARILEVQVPQVEQYERMRRGLMPYHATSVDELFFHHALPQLEDMERTAAAILSANPQSASASLGLGVARFCRGDRHSAEKYFHAFPEKIAGHIFETVRFAPAFHEALRQASDADLTKGLPPCIQVTPPVPDEAGVLYLSCDGKYLEFALPLLVSVRENSPSTPVHLHIMDASEDAIAKAVAICKKLAPLRTAISAENPGLGEGHVMRARCYYHAIRFIRLYEHMKVYRCPLWMSDVDAIVNRDLRPLFATMGTNDVAMRVRPGRIEPWNQFNASLVGFAPTQATEAYLRQIAMYIARFFQDGNLRWGIDQLAMYAVFADLQDLGKAPRLKLLDDMSIDYQHTSEGFIWCNSGLKKFKHLQYIANRQSMPVADFGDNKYVPVFEKYWRTLDELRAVIA